MYVPILALTQLYLVGCGKESKDVACLGSSFVSLASRGVKREREGTNLLCEGMMTEIVYGLCGWGRDGLLTLLVQQSHTSDLCLISTRKGRDPVGRARNPQEEKGTMSQCLNYVIDTAIFLFLPMLPFDHVPDAITTCTWERRHRVRPIGARLCVREADLGTIERGTSRCRSILNRPDQ